MKPLLEDFVLVIAESYLQDQEKIKPKTNFRELASWTSLQALLLVTTIDENYSVTLRESEMKPAQTFADLHQLVLQKLS